MQLQSAVRLSTFVVELCAAQLPPRLNASAQSNKGTNCLAWLEADARLRHHNIHRVHYAVNPDTDYGFDVLGLFSRTITSPLSREQFARFPIKAAKEPPL